MRRYFVASIVSSLVAAGAVQAQGSASLAPAPRIQFPGVAGKDADPQAAGEVDCNSPAHWDGGTLYMFFSTGHPFRSSGAGFDGLARPSVRVRFDNEEGWAMGGRWIEATHKTGDGKLYMWYHNEPPVVPGKTAPRIGQMVSGDNGLSWRDQGIILEAPAGSNNTDSANKYFVGGNGDFSVIADRKGEFLYFLISTYNKDIAEQGVAVARMHARDLADPKGKVLKWHKDAWNEPGLGGHVTPMFRAAVDWHLPVVDAFWGPSVHWNTHLEAWVMLLNRAKDKDWAQEGIYVTFNADIAAPKGWAPPVKILDAKDLEKSKWYPQVLGTNAGARETDKLAGQSARLFVAGVSAWEIRFRKAEKN